MFLRIPLDVVVDASLLNSNTTIAECKISELLMQPGQRPEPDRVVMQLVCIRGRLCCYWSLASVAAAVLLSFP